MQTHIVIICLLLTVFGNATLDLRSVCDSYHECLDEKSQLVGLCNGRKSSHHHCAIKLKNDHDAIEKYEKLIKDEGRLCVEIELERSNTTTIGSADKTRFCAGYLSNQTSQDGNCAMRIGRISNRCEALRRCCEPAARCEQTAVYSENGRTLSGLKEEVDIKMAECAQNDAPVTPVKKQKKIRIIKSPPFSLCLKYLECQKNAHQMRVNCSRSSNPHSVDGLDLEDTSDPTWQLCQSTLLTDFSLMNQRRAEAFSYLDTCVAVTNVTREFLTEERVCRASALKQRKLAKVTNCHLEVAQKRRECALLRDCCVQADVCERSALYAVISDEYLLRRTQLRETLNECMNRIPIDSQNSV